MKKLTLLITVCWLFLTSMVVHSQTLCDAADNCDLVFTTGGAAGWFYQTDITNDGEDALQTGDIQPNDTSWLETTVTGPGQISFYYTVSSYFNSLNFFINGNFENGISGNFTEWEYVTHYLEAGEHTLRWEYYKEANDTGIYGDVGFVDMVTFTPETNIPVDSVSIQGSSDTTLKVGQTLNLWAKVWPANATNQSVSWWSGDETVATVDEFGNVNAIAEGETAIWVESNENWEISDNILVTVSAATSIPITMVSIMEDKDTIAMKVGEQRYISTAYEPFDATNSVIDYMSTNPGIASIDPTYARIDAYKTGITIIYALAAENYNIYDSIIVNVTEDFAGGTFTVFFNNPDKWENVYVFWEDSINNPVSCSWPGFLMNMETNGWYSYDIPSEFYKIEFNNSSYTTGPLLRDYTGWYDGMQWYDTEPGQPAEEFVYDMDGNQYPVVVIGTQKWMAENLRATKYNDGSDILYLPDSVSWINQTGPAYCWYNNEQSTYGTTYGALYNGYTVFSGKLCPDGWHVPSEQEWIDMVNYLGGNEFAGGKLKTTDLWDSPNTEATNEIGFNGVPGGTRDDYGDFNSLGGNGFWWTSTETSPDYLKEFHLYFESGYVYNSESDKNYGFSVRCIKNNDTMPGPISNFPWFENFEGGNIPGGWKVLDIDKENYSWEISPNYNHTDAGTYSMSHTYNSIPQDGWLITPVIQCPTTGGLQLSFWSYNTFSYGKNSVLVAEYFGTEPVLQDFTEIWSPTSVVGAWEETILDLSSYAGKNILIAFRYEGTDAHEWDIDDVLLTSESGGGGIPTIPARIEAESFVNNANTVQFSTEGGKNQGIKYLNSSSYTDYMINVPTDGEYKLVMYVSSINDLGQAIIMYKGMEIGIFDIPVTGDDHNWIEITDTINLTYGNEAFISVNASTENAWNLNWFEIQTLGGGSGSSICDALDNCNFVFSSNTDNPWFIQSNEWQMNGSAMQSGKITHNGITWLATSIYGPGELSFWWKVSSESGYDMLKLFINDTQENFITGEVDWEQIIFPLAEGENHIRWEYFKNETGDAGADAAWVDNVQFTGTGGGGNTRIEAEYYNNQYGISQFSTMDTGLAITYTEYNSFTNYMIDVPYNGYYNLIFNVSSEFAEAAGQVDFDYSQLGYLTIPNTKDKHSWYDLKITDVYLNAGTGLQLKITNTGTVAWNLNWIEIQPVGGGEEESLVLSPDYIELDVNNYNSTTIDAYYSPSWNYPDNLTWTSTNPEVAWVDEYGTVYAVNSGETQIKACDATGKCATAMVFVKSGSQFSAWEDLKINWTIQDSSTRITGVIATENFSEYGSWTFDTSTYTHSWIDDTTLQVTCNRDENDNVWSTFAFNMGNITYGTNDSALTDDVYEGYTLDLHEKPVITLKVKTTSTEYVELRLDLIDVNGHASNYSPYFVYTDPAEPDYLYYEFYVYPENLFDTWSPEWWQQNNNRNEWDPYNSELIPVDMSKIASLYFMINPGYNFIENLNIEITELRAGTSVKAPPIESVYFYTDMVTLGEGETFTLTGDDIWIWPEDGDYATLAVFSRDESVATFSEGKITAVGEGTTYIVAIPEAALSETDIDSIEVTVISASNYEPVTGINIEADDFTTLEQGSWYYLYASIIPANATNQNIIWASSDENIVYFDYGSLYAMSPGTCTIRATSAVNADIYDEITITVTSAQIYSIEVYPENTTIGIGNNFMPEVYWEPWYVTDVKLKWTSNNPTVATVDYYGSINGRAAGIAIIKVEVESNPAIYDYITVNVTEDGSGTKWDEISYNYTINNYSEKLKGIKASDIEHQWNVTWLNGWDGQYEVNRISDSTMLVKYNRDYNNDMWSAFNCELGWVEHGNDWRGLYEDYFYGYTVDMLENPVVKLKIKSPQAFDLRIDLIDVNGHVTNGNGLTASINASADWTEYTFDFANMNLVDMHSNQWWGNEVERYNWANYNEPIPVNLTNIAGLSITVNPGISETNSFAFEMNQVVLGTVDETQKIPIQYFEISEYEVTMNVGATYQLNSYFEPQDATDKTLKFVSSNTQIATVDSKGKIYANAAGSAIINAYTQDGSGWSDYVYVYVNQSTIEVTGIDVNITGTLKVPVGNTDYSPMAIIYPSNASNKNVTWASDNSAVASVSSKGAVTGISKGFATITVSSDENPTIMKTFNVEITAFELYYDNFINAMIQAEALSEKASTNIGDAAGQYPQADYDAFNNEIDAAYTSLENSTLQSEIDAATNNIITATNTFKSSLIGSISVTGIALKTNTLQMTTKSSPALLTASITPADATNKSLTWNSSKPTVVKVDEFGIVIPVGGGNAKVYVTTKDGGYKDSCVITVTVPVESIGLISSTGLKVGNTLTLTANILPVNATNKTLSWTSQNTNIATVDKNGLVTAKAVGVVNISAASVENNLSAVCVVTVLSDEILVTAVDLPDTIITVAGKNIVIPASITPSNATNGKLVWTSSEASFIIDQNGLLTVTKGVTGYVFAKTQDGTIGDSTFVDVKASLPPVVGTIPAFTILTGTDSLNVTLTKYVTDDKTSSINLAFDANSSDNFEVNIKSGIMTVKPTSSTWTGTETIIVFVTDQDGFSAQMNITINVTGTANTAPVITAIPDQKIKVGNGFLPVNIISYITDDYTLPEDMEWSVVSTSNLFAFMVNGKLYIEVKDLTWVGTETLGLTAKDEGGLEAQAEITCIVSDETNMAPIISAIPVQERNNTTDFQTIVLNNYVTDDFTPKEYIKWTASKSSKININISNNIASVTIIDNNWMGSESVTFTAADQDGATGTATVIYNQKRTVSGGTWSGAPIVSFYADRTVVGVNSDVTLHGSITGEADDYAWTLPNGTPDESADLDPVIQYSKPGKYDVTFIAVKIDGETVLADTMTKTDYIRVVGISNNDTIICYGDSVTLTASDLNLSSYKWASETDPSTVISTSTSIKVAPLTNTKYILTSQNILTKYYDTVLVNVDLPLDLGPDQIICEGDSVIFEGTGFTSFNWNNGASTEATFTATTTGDVTLTAANALGCSYSDTASITVNPVPVVDLGTDVSTCWGNIVTLDAGTGAGYTYLWNTSETTQTIDVDTTGTYSVTVTNSYSCSTADDISVTTNLPYSGQEIFLVSVNKILNKNWIIWEKVPGNGITDYKIYKESSTQDEFNLIATIPYSGMNEYIDQNSNPKVKWAKYKISIVDTCGNESEMSPAHKTIHLTSNLGTNNTINLIWSDYEGFTFGTYYIYRGLDSTDVEILDSITSSPGTDNTWTDLNPPATDVDIYYNIEVRRTESIFIFDTKKASSGPFDRSTSNMEDNRLRSSNTDMIADHMKNESNMIVYPNPISKHATILSKNKNELIQSIEIYDLRGNQVKTQYNINNTEYVLNKEGLKEGVYALRIIGDKNYMVTIMIK